MVMPFLMISAEWFWLKKKNKSCHDLAKAWSKGVAILFAVGAVSGTVLSFELGLLWPSFMEQAGPIIGMPFSLETAAFFLEAIAIGIYLYGWDRISPRLHLASGFLVGLAGISSGIIVISANSWMNSPAGFEWVNGTAIHIDPLKAIFNKAWFSEATHMTLAAFSATGFAVAGIHAFFLRRNPKNSFHRYALGIALSLAVVASLLQPFSGDLSARDIARRQPLKLAAAESLFKTQKAAPILIGGIPDMKTQESHYGIEIPALLSFLAFDDVEAEVKGLDAFPRENWPPIPVVHYAFQIMVGIGSFLAGVSLLILFLFLFKRTFLFRRAFLGLLAFCTPLGFIALEAGWVVTETGRQPWILYEILKTKDSLTPMPGLIYPFLGITMTYIFLSLAVFFLMLRQFKSISGNGFGSVKERPL
ncbi:MAG: cytochrome ubiquinol oxidase subunit I [Deltaproteobacteria bacterium]|nr:cytochrome ubiquinol oxidase subunit I [Deltaproteobacteria bacterium]